MYTYQIGMEPSLTSLTLSKFVEMASTSQECLQEVRALPPRIQEEVAVRLFKREEPRGYAALAQAFFCVYALEFSGEKAAISLNAAIALSKKSLKVLSLRNVPRKIMQSLYLPDGLEQLMLHDCYITSRLLSSLKKQKQLKRLVITKRSVTLLPASLVMKIESTLQMLRELEELRLINIYSDRDITASLLAGKSNLRVLHLYNTRNPSESTLVNLAIRAHHLAVLHLFGVVESGPNAQGSLANYVTKNPHLQELSLNGAWLSEDLLNALAASSSQLNRLVVLSGDFWTTGRLQKLVEATSLRKLETLELTGLGKDGSGFLEVLSSSAFETLRSLKLGLERDFYRGNSETESLKLRIAKLFQSSWMKRLRELHLVRFILSDDEYRMLALSIKLESLTLEQAMVAPRSLLVFLGTLSEEVGRNFRAFHILNNQRQWNGGSSTLTVLAFKMPHLKSLGLSQIGLSKMHIESLSKLSSSLVALDISKNTRMCRFMPGEKMENTFVDILARVFPHLVCLDVSHSSFCNIEVFNLRKLKCLEVLRASSTELKEEEWASFIPHFSTLKKVVGAGIKLPPQFKHLWDCSDSFELQRLDAMQGE